jgi:hypothetical protein
MDEVDAEPARCTDAAELEKFLTGPGVVWVVGPPHPQRSSVATALATAVPTAVVTEHDAAALPPAHRWDVAVVVTPADQVLSARETEFVVDAAARGQAVLLVVSRMHVLGDDRARAAGRAEIERYRLIDVLGPRRIPWFFDEADGDAWSGAVAAGVSDALERQQDHAAAGDAEVRALLDRMIDRLAARLPDREADLRRLDAVGAQFAAHSGYLRGLAHEYVARGVERIHTGNDRMVQALGTVVDAADTWLAADGAAPWPDAEGPIRRAWAETVRAAHALPTALRAELGSEIARVEGNVRRELMPLVPELDATPAAGPPWRLDDLEAALARLAEVDLGPALQRAENRTRAALAAEQDERRAAVGSRGVAPMPSRTSPARSANVRRPAVDGAGTATNTAGTATNGGGDVGRGLQAARALRHGVARATGAALRKLDSTPLTEDLRAALLADITAAVGGRLDEVMAAVGREAEPAARAECEAAVERLGSTLAAAQEAADRRHGWYGAYRGLLDLRHAPSPASARR